MSRAPERLEELKAATQKGFEPLMEEVKRSIDFFENETGEAIPSVWLSGGGALCVEAAQTLSAGLGKTVAFWDNLKKMEIAPEVDQKFLEANASQFNVAFGTALRT